MNEQEIIGKIGFITLFIFFVCFVYIVERIEKKSELKEKEREEYMEQKRLENSKKEALEWNNKIQSNTKNEKKIYKVSRRIKALVGNYSISMSVYTNTILKSLGIETEFVPQAHNIIDKINNNEKFDIIITNNMYYHGESGNQVLKELKAKKEFNTPIIVLTVDQNARHEYVKDGGFDEYIAKPITPENAIPIFEKVIRNISFEKVKKQ